MSLPAALAIAGIDPFLNDEQSREMQEALQKEEMMIASLDAEISAAYIALEQLKRQRSEKQRLIYLNSAPSEAEVLVLQNAILQREKRLERLDEEIKESKLALEVLMREQADHKDAGTVEPSSHNPQTPINGDDAKSLSFSLCQINAEIRRYKNAIRYLTSEREEVLADLDAQKTQLTPIRRLPLEILSLVFLHCLPDQEFVEPRPLDAPLLLTHVCRVWRDLALSMSSLWSSISVRADKEGCYPRKKLLEIWLQRSGSKPLHFRIHEDIPYSLVQELGVESFTTCADLLDFFLPAFDRWRSVSLEYRDWKLNNTGFQKIPLNPGPPCLERLSLIRDYWEESTHAPLHALFSAPRLKSIFWDGILRSYPNPADIMPLQQLSDLCLSRNILNNNQFISVLRQTSNLVACDLYATFLSIDEDRQVLSAPLVFPHLKSLCLVTNVLDERICGAIVAPSLTTFSVTRPTLGWNGFTPEKFWSHEDFKKWSQKSKFSLKTLDLSDTDITPPELLDLLQYFSPTLENLVLANDHVEHKCVDDMVLRALTPPTMNLNNENDCTKWLCPNLKYIKFWDCICSTDGVMAGMFESRWDYGNAKTKRLRMAMVKEDESAEEGFYFTAADAGAGLGWATSSQPSTSRLPMSDEISDVTEILTELQSRFASLQQKFDQETLFLRNRIKELENERDELINANRWLEHQIESLESRVENFKPDLHNAIDAREAAINKLRRTRKVLRDVINEFEEKFDAHPESLTQWEQEQPELEVDRPQQPSYYANSNRSAHHSSHVDDDVRSTGSRNSQSSLAAPSQRASRASAISIAESMSPPREHTQDEEEGNISITGSLPTDLVPQPKSYPIRRVSASGVTEDYDNWRVQFANPPASSRVKSGPISWKDLKNPEKFDFDEQTISALENVSRNTQLELCVHIARNFAFVRDPTFLEDKRGKASYLLDWGSKEGNRHIKQYITTSGKAYDSVFHTFVFITDVKEQGRWYYLGAQKWQVTDIDKIWNVLALGSRGAVLDKLIKRSRGNVERHAISKALDGGELAQISVHLTGDSYVEISRTQCLKMGYKAKEKSPK
ncbi:hypothetical protein K435DRAFT_833591 [Dendrothele bispora CBS 962.96]|uniref:Uncharacterized protein n=1 Tax=Dendrothele bispora (strain CBS 962.96) TaxID=1314807 RepID=A0A4S8MVU3_DENBC|nr:hypothetical protein K435DRAFT_833591 [Dendrothele bispora CBS 962.96]